MNAAERKRTALRERLSGTSPVVAVGAHDAMTVQLIETHGLDAVWVTASEFRR